FLVCPVGQVSQPGPTIYNSNGDLVWSDPSIGPCTDLNLQMFDGQQYLTMWVGFGLAANMPQTGTGNGVAVMMNSEYEIVKNVSAVNPMGTDLHEFNIVQPANKTALVTAYNPIPFDLSSIGGLANGWYLNSIIQEVDIASGRILFNWSSVDHIPLSESYNNISLTGEGTSSTHAWDGVHVNSIAKDREGNYLVSSRHCQTIYKIAKNGTILWRLGGKISDFTAIGNDTEFHWQHHARWRNDETQISLFDDGAASIELTVIVDEPVATGKYLNVDQKTMTVSLAKRFFPSPNSDLSLAEGSTEPYGDTVVVGYGNNPWVTVHDFASASVLFSAIIGPNNASFHGINNYRAFQTSTLQFAGHPKQPPAVALSGGDVYVSWNGATHVASYTLLTGHSANDVRTRVTNVPKAGFETKIHGSGIEAFFKVAALAKNGITLG
ncbi:ASST-domain-containing protein, partial [Mycena pura]